MRRRRRGLVRQLLRSVLNLALASALLVLVGLPWLGYVVASESEVVQSWSKLHDFLWFTLSALVFLVVFVIFLCWSGLTEGRMSVSQPAQVEIHPTEWASKLTGRRRA